MTEKIVIASAKKASDLAATYDKVKTHAKDYGFSAVTALREEVVSKAMTEKKKAADFIVEADILDKIVLVQLVCDVKGAMRSVIGRKEIKTVKEFESAVMLAKNQALKKATKEFLL